LITQQVCSKPFGAALRIKQLQTNGNTLEVASHETSSEYYREKMLAIAKMNSAIKVKF
jgi:hypothetical protein